MFTRTVQIDGVLYREHAATAIEHVLKNDLSSGSTWVRVLSSVGRETKNTRHELPMNIGMTFQQAEEAVKALPFFAAHEDPYAEVVDELNGLVDEIAGMLDDEEAATVPQAYREWQPDTAYIIGDRRRYNGVLYKCLQAHTSQADQAPDIATSLWARILNPDPDVPLPWEQPDSTNPYMTGDKVTHNGYLWISDIDYNVYEPGVAGWTCLDPEPEPEPEPEPTPEPEPSDYDVWVQPDSANPYKIGDRVHFPTADDPVYESDYDNNVWAPNVFGWHVVEAD